MTNAIGGAFRRRVLERRPGLDGRDRGADAVLIRLRHITSSIPAAAKSPWHPEVLEQMGGPEWQQLYVNAEHDGEVGVITIGRGEATTGMSTPSSTAAIDWLKGRKSVASL